MTLSHVCAAIAASLSLAITGGMATGDIINVPADRPTIQAGIDAAINGDEVVVAPNTYNESINFMGKAITVRSSGGAAATIIDGTGSLHVVQCVSGEGPDTVLDGFTITRGNANGGSSPDNRGGGMLNLGSSPTVLNCIFTDNQAVDGGGMSNTGGSSPIVTDCAFTSNVASNTGAGMHNNTGSSPTVTGCTFDFNTSDSDGGGMYNTNAAPTVTDCTFHVNSGSMGGAMYNFGINSPTVSGCTFTGNTATSFGAGMVNVDSVVIVTGCVFDGNSSVLGGAGMMNLGGGGSTVSQCVFIGNMSSFNGGGMYNESSSRSTVIGCAFIGNSAAFDGGGMSNNLESSPTVIGCTFTMNEAGGDGGGMNTDANTSVGPVTPIVTNCTFNMNTAEGDGGGMSNRNSSAIVTNCTFNANTAVGSGGGMVSSDMSAPTLANCVLWFNGPNQIADLAGAATAASFSNVEGGWPGTGNIDADPLFADAVGHLSTGSPCIDAGDNALVPPDTEDLNDNGDTLEPTPFDLDGNPRFIDDPAAADTGSGTPPIVDMGAFEHAPPPCPADLSGDGNVDIVDLLQLLAAWGVCPLCPEDLDGTGAVDISDLLALLSAWGPCP